MLHGLLFRDGETTGADVDPSRLPELGGPRTVVWAAGDPGSPADLDSAAALCGIPRARIEAIMTPGRRGRLWRSDGRYALPAQAVRPSADGAEFTRLVMLVSPDAMVTFSEKPALDIGSVLADDLDHAAVARDGTAALVRHVVERLITGYQETVLDIDEGISEVEELLFENAPAVIARVQRDTHLLRRRLALLRRAVLPLREALDELRQADTRTKGRPGQHVHGLVRQLDHLLGLIDSLREMLVSVLGTNINLQQNRLNVTMKKLTGWAAVIAIPALITSWYGMNVELPGRHELWGAVLANVLVMGAALAIYLSFRRRDWL
ncbi:magnesium transporter CorA family protein [Allosalinactinospora lopnorensis]|uniref:magnesium transporter CorA family protein n=1 Tax=Allosalinactinospora lopnorensis TaxID=1352348 RepID=UPI000623F702|nr:CorA family divalent cation transporter [Allosalinactinospora lopnorensis]